MLDLNDIAPQPPPAPQPALYVRWRDIKDAVQGRETEILGKLGIIWRNGGTHVRCPYPDHEDRNPSWRWDDAAGRAHCSCSLSDSIFDVVGKVERLPFDAAKLRVAEMLGREDLVADPAAAPKGLSLQEYADAKGLPIDFLRGIGVSQGRYGSVPVALRTVYARPNGEPPSIRFRVSLAGDKRQRHFWRKGDKACLYGAWNASALAGAPFVVLVEGESDTQTLWFHGIPALGLPGGGVWNEEQNAPLLASVPLVYVVVEPDKGGEATLRWLARSAIAPRARLIRLAAPTKDPSALYLADRAGFPAAWRRAMEAAEPFPVAQHRTAEEPQDELGKLIAEFNARYAVVNESGKVVVYERVLDLSLRRHKIDRIAFADLKRLYSNRWISVPNRHGGATAKTAADWWLGHRERRTYQGVIFDPTGETPASHWNLWTGFAVDPAPGDWSLMKEHVRVVICRGDPIQFDYLMDWTARMFQRPNEPGEVAIVVRGKKGSGKGIFLSAIVRAWGSHGIHIHDAKHLIGHFNAHLRDCVALFADEAFFAGDRQGEGTLKGLITEVMLPIEGKGQNLISVLNMLHVMMGSNSDWVVPATHDERRYAVFDASDHRIGQRAYFAAVVRQMDNGGLAAMIHEMLHRDISGFEVRDVPNTQALVDQKLHSLDTLDRWWLAVLERGFVWRSRFGCPVFQEWQEFYTTELLHRSYLQWCKENNVSRPMTRIQMGARLHTMYSPCRPRGERIIGELESATQGFIHNDLAVKADHMPGYVVDGIDLARARFSDIMGVSGDWITNT